MCVFMKNMVMKVHDSVGSKMSGLRRFNVVVAVLHLVQGISMLLVSSDFSLPVNTSFQIMDQSQFRLVTDLQTVGELQIGPVVAIFLLLSAAAHFLVAAPTIYSWYARNLGQGINYARWIEYSISASLMIVVIAMLVGILDLVALILIFALNATMICFGWMMERHNQRTEHTDWTAFWFGCLAGAVPWLVIGIHLVGAGGEGQRAPSFVYVIFISIFLVFNTFSANMWLQYRRIGRWRDYLYGERTYIVLSLVAKSLLAWQVFAGTLRPV